MVLNSFLRCTHFAAVSSKLCRWGTSEEVHCHCWAPSDTECKFPTSLFLCYTVLLGWANGRYGWKLNGARILVGYFMRGHCYLCGPGISVGIATELRVGRSGIESRWGRDFPPAQTCPGNHTAFCTMGTGSYPGVKCGRGVLLTTHPLLVPRSWKRRAIPLPILLGHTGPITGSLYLYTIDMLQLIWTTCNAQRCAVALWV